MEIKKLNECTTIVKLPFAGTTAAMDLIAAARKADMGVAFTMPVPMEGTLAKFWVDNECVEDFVELYQKEYEETEKATIAYLGAEYFS